MATFHRGDHFGEVAIVGFRPQPATVVALERTLLFVLGRRYLLSVVANDPSVRRVLFPDVEPGDYRAFVRRLYGQGYADWKALARRRRSAHELTEPSYGPRERRPGRPMSWTQAIQLLSGSRPSTVTPLPLPVETPAARIIRRTAVTVGTIVAVAASFAYHPPVAVITAGRPIDIAHDIRIEGTRVYPINGRYILTAVDVDQPSLAGMLLAFVRRQAVATVDGDTPSRQDLEMRHRHSREAYFSSQLNAIAAVEKTLGTSGMKIVVRDRGLEGPSAGLVYALALADLLGPQDLADGRAIAATGEIDRDGGVRDVWFARVKARTARASGASLFLVPEGQRRDARSGAIDVVGVTDLQAALATLKKGA